MLGELIIEKDTLKKEIHLIGVLSEDMDFNRFESLLQKYKTVNMNGVEKLTSMGIAAWVHFYKNFFKKYPALKGQIILKECAFFVVEQFSFLPEFLIGLEIESIVIPFYCEDCDLDFSEIKQVASIKECDDPYDLKKPCPDCKTESELSYYCTDYFAFLELDE